MNQKYILRFKYFIYFFIHILSDKVLLNLSRLKIASDERTINEIISRKVSISRFGDGEFRLMQGHDTGFQTANPRICALLKEILKSNNNNHIVGIPYAWKKLLEFKYSAFEYWGAYLLGNLNHLMCYFDTSIQYYSSTFTRFYIDYSSDSNAKRIVPLIKKIWDNKRICIIEGNKSRMGVGNDFFANASNIKRIVCPSTNAFDVYDKIIDSVEQETNEDLYVIALGMTATCLAYDLAQRGYWAIDLGHADIEYEWFLKKAKRKEPIAGKFVAESKNDLLNETIDLSEYNSQIIKVIE